MPGKRKNTATAGEVATALFIPEKGVMRIVVDKDHVMEDGTRFAEMKAAKDLNMIDKLPNPKKDPCLTVRITEKFQPITQDQINELITFGDPEGTIQEAIAKLRAETQKAMDQDLVRGALILHLTTARDKATVLDTFDIRLDGTGSRCQFPTQIVTLLGLPATDRRATLDIKPANITIPTGKTHTEWGTAKQMKISLQLELNEEQQQRLLFRWNLKASRKNELETHMKLVLEALVIPPPHDLITGMKASEREVVNGPNAQVHRIHAVPKPISWTQKLDPPAVNAGLVAVPWLSVGTLDESNPPSPPSGEFLHRYVYHIATLGYQGKDLKYKEMTDYKDTWPERLKPGLKYWYPSLWLPQLDTYTVYETIRDKEVDDHHKEIEKDLGRLALMRAPFWFKLSYVAGTDATELRPERIYLAGNADMADDQNRPVHEKVYEAAQEETEKALDEGSKVYSIRLEEVIWRDKKTGQFHSKPWVEPQSRPKGLPTNMSAEELARIASTERENSPGREGTPESNYSDASPRRNSAQNDQTVSPDSTPERSKKQKTTESDPLTLDPQVEAMFRAMGKYLAHEVLHDCAYKTNGCCYTHRDLEILKQHIDTCPMKPKEDGKEDILANIAYDKYKKHEIIRKTREINNETDDNYALLTESRFWSAPSSWTQHQAGAVKTKVGAFMRWNYHFDRIGLTVRNKAITMEIHDTKSKSR